MASAMVSVNLPWLWGPQADRTQWREKAWEQAQAELVKTENDVEYELGVMLAMIQRLYSSWRLYEEEILPQARQSLEQAETQYQVNKVDFLTLLENQMTVFKHEVNLWQTLGDFHKRISDLRVIVGTEVKNENE